MLTATRAREVLHYNPTTGVFRWAASDNRRIRCGAVAGDVGKLGYRRIGIDGERYLAHRVAWLWMTGAWPQNRVDHINGSTDDNRWENLRDVNASANGLNRHSPGRSNTTGFQNVIFCKKTGKWRFNLTARFDTAEKAEAVVAELRKVLLEHALA